MVLPSTGCMFAFRVRRSSDFCVYLEWYDEPSRVYRFGSEKNGMLAFLSLSASAVAAAPLPVAAAPLVVEVGRRRPPPRSR